VSTQIWRNVCPLATLNSLTGSSIGSRQLDAKWVVPAGAVGMLLLYVMVPARRFLFNVDGPVLAITIAVVAALALVGGLFFDKKGGFCNAVCPVLPVERLYGQRPFMQVSNPRCQPCTTCTKMACLDLMPTRSAHRMLGKSYASNAWLGSLSGVFALSFPGFVLAYNMTVDGPLSSALSVYGMILLYSASSWLVLAALVAITKMKSDKALVLCAGLAIGLYYWFAPSGTVTAFGLPTAFVWVLRVVLLGLVAAWFVKGWNANGGTRRAAVGAP
jgi:hypothetical protein